MIFMRNVRVFLSPYQRQNIFTTVAHTSKYFVLTKGSDGLNNKNKNWTHHKSRDNSGEEKKYSSGNSPPPLSLSLVGCLVILENQQKS